MSSSFLLLSSLCSPSLSWAWSKQQCQPLRMAGLLLCDVLLAGPISLGNRWCHNPFAQRKDSDSLCPVDGMLIPVTFLEKIKSPVMQIYFIACKQLLASAGIELLPHWKQFMKWTISLWASCPWLDTMLFCFKISTIIYKLKKHIDMMDVTRFKQGENIIYMKLYQIMRWFVFSCSLS